MSAKYTDQFCADVLFYAAARLRTSPNNKALFTEFRQGIKRTLDSISLKSPGRQIGTFVSHTTRELCDVYQVNYNTRSRQYALYYFFDKDNKKNSLTHTKLYALCMFNATNDLPKHLNNLGVTLDCFGHRRKIFLPSKYYAEAR
ncbi:MAG: hypothetical protein IKY83_05090 [Proteobacteria bacterium]|nr:hypothetical protein [Pseudomonadota bacterium]